MTLVASTFDTSLLNSVCEDLFILKELLPNVEFSRIKMVYEHHNCNVERASEALFSSDFEKEYVGGVMDETTRQPTYSEETTHLKFLAQACRDFPIIDVTEKEPNTRTVAFYSLGNGDCAPHCMGMALAFLSKSLPKLKAEHEFLGKTVRDSIIDFLEKNWDKTSLTTGVEWHETVYMSHNLAITEEERETYGDWGETSSTRLECWKRERDELFFTTSEFLAFHELMKTMGVPIIFRMWRQDRNMFFKVGQVPENADNGLVFDVKHTGKYDSGTAHWQLLKSGSASSQKRKRE